MRSLALLMMILAGCTQTPKEAPSETTTEAKIPNIEEIAMKAYKQAYSIGQNRFMAQIGIATRTWKYTSSEDEDITEEKINKFAERDQEIIKDAMRRGYVDGYHSAGESNTCPRFR